MSVKNIFLTVVGVVIASAIAFALWQENKPKDKIDFKLHLKSGDAYEFKVTYSGVSTYKTKTKQEQSDLQDEAVIGINVASVDNNGIMNLELFYKAVKFKIGSSFLENFEYDSANPNSSEPNSYLHKAIAIVYPALIGSKFRTQVNPLGEISNLEGFTEANEKIKQMIKNEHEKVIAAAVDINDTRKQDKDTARMLEKMIAQISGSKISDETCEKVLASAIEDLKELVGEIIIKFPQPLIFTGGKWQGKTKLNLGFSAEADTTYTFKKRENGNVYIDSVAKFDMGKRFTTLDIDYYGKRLRQISGQRKSSGIFDETTGLLRKSESVSEFSGIERREADYLIGTGNIPMTIKSNMTIEMLQ